MSTIDPRIIVAALLGEATEDDERALAEWRRASLANEKEFRDLSRLWRETGALPEPPGTPPAPPPTSVILERAARRAAQGPGPAPRPAERPDPGLRRSARARRRAWFVRLSGMAAALAVGLGLGVTWGRTPDRFGPQELVTGDNEVATLTLVDETVVRLAPGSRLSFSEAENVREVSLTGRAYFAVAKDPERPFRVRLPSGDIEVLGTRFDVASGGQDIQVAVVEGQVRVMAQGARLELEANQVARVPARGTPEVHRVEDPYEVINWLGRFLAFEETPLIQVAEEFRSRFGLDIEVADAALRDRTLTGWFADQSPDEMIAGICTVLEATCPSSGGVVRMQLGPDPRASRPAGESRRSE